MQFNKPQFENSNIDFITKIVNQQMRHQPINIQNSRHEEMNHEMNHEVNENHTVNLQPRDNNHQRQPVDDFIQEEHDMMGDEFLMDRNGMMGLIQNMQSQFGGQDEGLPHQFDQIRQQQAQFQRAQQVQQQNGQNRIQVTQQQLQSIMQLLAQQQRNPTQFASHAQEADNLHEDQREEMKIEIPAKNYKFSNVVNSNSVGNHSDHQAQFKISVNPHLIQQNETRKIQEIRQQKLEFEKKFFIDERTRRSMAKRNEEEIKFDTNCENLKDSYFKQFREQQFLNPFVTKIDTSIKIFCFKKRTKEPLIQVKNSHIEKVMDSFNTLANYTYCQRTLDQHKIYFNSIFTDDHSVNDLEIKQEKQVFTFYEKLINLFKAQHIPKGKLQIRSQNKPKKQTEEPEQVEQQERFNVVFEKAIIDRFIYIAEKQTKQKIPMIGLIYSHQNEQLVEISSKQENRMLGDTLIIPKQKVIQNGCGYYQLIEILNLEECHEFAKNWDRKKLVGWIITHPSQDQFMNSFDLHQQYSFQSNEKDFDVIGVVYAPSREIKLQGYHLSDPGIREISNCKETGLHDTHSENGHKLVTKTTEFRIIKDLKFKFQIEDMRPI